MLSPMRSSVLLICKLIWLLCVLIGSFDVAKPNLDPSPLGVSVGESHAQRMDQWRCLAGLGHGHVASMVPHATGACHVTSMVPRATGACHVASMVPRVTGACHVTFMAHLDSFIQNLFSSATPISPTLTLTSRRCQGLRASPLWGTVTKQGRRRVSLHSEVMVQGLTSVTQGLRRVMVEAPPVYR